MKDFRVELKVCEGCGALWLRAAEFGVSRVFCHACARRLSEFPVVLKSRRGRKRKAARTTAARTAAVCAGGAK